MRTSEDVRESGLYVSECCGEERIFKEGDTFWRCPHCQHLCDWSFAQITESELEPAVA